MNTDVAIIGAGVLGVTLAYHLAKHRKSVVLLEREPYAAAHASGKNAGMFRQLYRHAQLADWAARSRNLWPDELKEKVFRQTGSLIVGRSVPPHHQELYQQRQFSYRTNEPPASAVLTETDGLLDPADYVSLICGLTDRSRVQYRFRTAVTAVEQKKNAFRLHLSSGGTVSAEWVVNAAGAWLNSFLPERMAARAKPFARHLFVIDGWEESLMPSPAVGFFWDEQAGWYARRWDGKGQLVSICDFIPADPDHYSPQANLSAAVADRLISSLGEQANCLELRQSWHCFRTYCDDEHPIWGADPRMPRFFWLAAFGGFGMSTSFAAALDAALSICGETVSVAEEFGPERVVDV